MIVILSTISYKILLKIHNLPDYYTIISLIFLRLSRKLSSAQVFTVSYKYLPQRYCIIKTRTQTIQ